MAVKHKAVKVKGEVLRAEEWNQPHDAPLSALDDVEITAPADGEVLTFESATGLWKNKPAVGVSPLKQVIFDYLTTDKEITTKNVYYTVFSKTITTNGGYVEIHAIVQYNMYMGAGVLNGTYSTIVIDGTMKKRAIQHMSNPTGVTRYIRQIVILHWMEQLPAGTHTIEIQANSIDVSTGFIEADIGSTSLIIKEYA